MPDKYKPREFSNKQNDMLDDVYANELEIDGKARAIVDAAREGDMTSVILDAVDIRNLTLTNRDKIRSAQRGEYGT